MGDIGDVKGIETNGNLTRNLVQGGWGTGSRKWGGNTGAHRSDLEGWGLR